MRNTLMIGLAAISLLGAQPCLAGYMASLSTTAPDLNNLTVGQKVTFDVNLSGIGSPANNLDFLAATVQFDGGHLGTPTITAGSIVPDLSGFQSTATAGRPTPITTHYSRPARRSPATGPSTPSMRPSKAPAPGRSASISSVPCRARMKCPSRPAPRCCSAPAWSRNPRRGSSSGLGCWEPPPQSSGDTIRNSLGESNIQGRSLRRIAIRQARLERVALRLLSTGEMATHVI